MSLFDPLPDPEPSSTVGFGRNPLDRAEHLRGSAETIRDLLAAPEARFMIVAGDRLAFTSDAGAATAFHRADIAAAHGDLGEPILLGLNGKAPRFAVASPGGAEAFEAAGLSSLDIRSLLMSEALPEHELGAAAEARSLVHWHRSHRFCALCGALSKMANAGWRRDCPQCGAAHFPRTDPVVIMLAVDGERCLLGRQPRFAPGMYSCLAGFVEPGETLEDAVRREIFEEAGIRIGRVRYLASQPWPMPSSLMVGFFAEALSREIVRDETELEDVRWFGRDEVAQMLEDGHPLGLKAPRRPTIASLILRSWMTMA